MIYAILNELFLLKYGVKKDSCKNNSGHVYPIKKKQKTENITKVLVILDLYFNINIYEYICMHEYRTLILTIYIHNICGAIHL